MTTDLSSLALLASNSHGLIRYAEARRLGFTDKQLRSLIACGWCSRLARGVYRVDGSPGTPDQLLLSHVWASDDDALASHLAAGRVWGIPSFDRAEPEVLRPRGQNQRLATGRVHTCLVLPPRHRTVVRSIPVTTPARTIFDLAGVIHPQRTERALDFVLQRKLCTLADLHQAFSSLARQGRRGTATMRKLLVDRGIGYVPPASALEALARRVFSEGGLPTPDFEVDLGSDEWIGRVDCLWRAQRVIVEVDSQLHHGSLSARRDDRRRDNRLMSEGWRVIRVTWDDLKQRPAEVIAWIRRALAVAV